MTVRWGQAVVRFDNFQFPTIIIDLEVLLDNLTVKVKLFNYTLYYSTRSSSFQVIPSTSPTASFI